MSFAANLTKIVAGGQGLLFCITIWVSKIWFSNFVCTRISGFLSIFNIISYHSLKDIWIRFVFFEMRGNFVCVMSGEKKMTATHQRSPATMSVPAMDRWIPREEVGDCGSGEDCPILEGKGGLDLGTVGREVTWRSFRMEKLAKQKRTKKRKGGWQKAQNASNNSLRVK